MLDSGSPIRNAAGSRMIARPNARHHRRRRYTTKPDRTGAPVPDLVGRLFDPIHHRKSRNAAQNQGPATTRY